MARKTNYGCVKCQTRHYSGQPLYDEHLPCQSKHGFQHSDQYEPFRPANVGGKPDNWTTQRHGFNSPSTFDMGDPT